MTGSSASPDSTPHVVILGGGFGGLAAARTLSGAPVRITLIDRTNHHVFQPLLYQVATAALAPSDITVPIRWRLRNQRNADVLLADVTTVDVERRVVIMDAERRELSYDYLIVATGARHAYFGHDQWEANAPGLKSIDDAYSMRRRFLLAFENAEKAVNEAERDAHLTFVVVGAGPTGVELAGAMAEIARGALWREFRHIDPRKARVMLIEAGPRILSAFPEDLSRSAQQSLERLGVKVRTGCTVTDVGEHEVRIGDEHVPTHTVFWAAGVLASSLGGQLGAETDRSGRVKVLPDLSVPSHPEVFVIGDLALTLRKDGTPTPAVAPTANQTGAHAARMIMNTMKGRAREPFHYFHKGELATIGRHNAVAAFGNLHLHGFLAWCLWLSVHILYLVGFRNRVSVMVQWAYAYFTYQRGVRLISGAGKPLPATTAIAHGAAPDVNVARATADVVRG